MKIALVVAALLLTVTCFVLGADLQVSAAASLTDALNEIGTQYQRTTGTHVLFNFAASSVLARQISEGAPVDIFFSADEEKMDDLQKKQLLLTETRRSLLSNSLVIVVPFDSKLMINDPRELAEENWKIALAEPKTVPAGIYAKKYLENAGLWSKVVDRIIPTENVRAALAAVESGNVDLGIVYKTDAAISKRVKIAYEVPMKDTPKISYPVAVVRSSSKLSEARNFVEFLASPAALSIFKKYGFLIP